MSIEKNVLTRAVAFRQARQELTEALSKWRTAKGTEGEAAALAAKDAAGAAVDKAQSALLMATELYERRFLKPP